MNSRLSMKHFVGLEEDVADGENQFAHSLVAQFKATRTQWPKVGENSEANDCHVHVAVGEEFDGVSMALPLFGPYRIHPDPNCNPKFERKALGIWKKMMEVWCEWWGEENNFCFNFLRMFSC